MKSSKTILVLGATGQQGGAVAQQLVSNEWNVRALVRNPNKASARLLQQQGIEIVQGDLDNPTTIKDAMRNVYGVFSVQGLDIEDLDKELRHGKYIADYAKSAGVSHFVYSSASGANRNTGITSFENKGKIEQYIHSLDLPATILRPVMFMENFRFTLQKVNNKMILPYKGALETKIQMIAVQDIGIFTLKAFNHPNQFIGKSFDIAGDELSVTQLIEKISKYFGISVEYPTSPPPSTHEHDGIKATKFFIKEGYQSDMEFLRQSNPRFLSFDAWLQQSDLQF
ncbi:NmrA/HSCARG family protein [Shimazuella kribbensis]|uniref:NmrA/HSCARG family protein n=1 Tax=Shimazuella kribbensis TaxID=139808 RepID=UPI0004241B88|nr:NmrA/HSCARG family protein [Shimazuella kribbensis]